MSVRRLSGVCGLVSLLALTTARAEDADLSACAARALPERTMRQVQTVRVVSEAGWERESLRSVAWQRFDDGTIKVLFEVLRPKTEAGLKLLVSARPNEDPVIHVYTPDLGRARRVVGSGASNSVLGTDFTFEDAQHLQQFLTQAGTRRIADAELDGYSMMVAETVTAPDASAYSLIRTYIDKTSCLPFKTEFLGPNGALDKTLLIERDAVRQIEGHFIPLRMIMYNHKQKQRTELTATEVAVNLDLPAAMFSLAEIEKSH